MAEIWNCTRCGQMMVAKYHSICNDCKEAQRADIEKVKEYILTHPQPNLMEMYQETGVPLTTLQRFIKEGVITRM